MFNPIKRWWYKGILPGGLITINSRFYTGRDLIDEEHEIGSGDTLKVLAVSRGISQVLCQVQSVGERDNHGCIPGSSDSIPAVFPKTKLYVRRSVLRLCLADQKLAQRRQYERHVLLDKAMPWTKAR